MEKRTKIVFIVNPISGTSDKQHSVHRSPTYLDTNRFKWTSSKPDHKWHAA